MIIEKKIYDYLKNKLSVHVGMERPQNPLESYVIIERVGGY